MRGNDGAGGWPRPPHSPRHASTALANLNTSPCVLYIGAGEIRITSGSRQSPSTPWVAMKSNSERPASRPVRPRPSTTRSESCAAAFGLARGGDLQRVRQSFADQGFQVAGQAFGLLAQRGHAGTVEQFQRAAQWRQAEDWRVAQLPAVGARRGHEVGPHAEARALFGVQGQGEADPRQKKE